MTEEKSWTERIVTLVFFVIFAFVCFFCGALVQRLGEKERENQVEKMIALPACEYQMDNIRVIDGDTIEADIQFPLGITLRGEYIRFSDYDAWESSRRRRSVKVTDEEVVKGKQATIMLREFLEGKTVVLLLDRGERDNYGRVLGRAAVYADDGSRTEVIEFMSENDLLRTSNGKAKGDEP